MEPWVRPYLWILFENSTRLMQHQTQASDIGPALAEKLLKMNSCITLKDKVYLECMTLTYWRSITDLKTIW